MRSGNGSDAPGHWTRCPSRWHPARLWRWSGRTGQAKPRCCGVWRGSWGRTGGRFSTDGERFNRGRVDLRRRLYFLPDFPFLFWEHDVIQHAGMFLRVYGVRAPEREASVLELLRDFDLLPLARRKLGTLSRGEIYKAGLVLLMAVDPELWLLDEPFASGMDPHGIGAFRRRAKQAAARGRTVIFSTQLLDLAERFADRICVLHRGELHLCETVAALAPRITVEGGALENIFRQLRSGAP